MSLYEKLSAARDLGDAQRGRKNAHPKGFEPGVKFDNSGIPTEVITDVMPHLPTQEDWDNAVAKMGVPIPDGYRLRLVEAKYDPAAWHRDEQGQDAVTRPVWRYKFAVEYFGTEESISAEVFVKLKQLRKNRDRIQPSYSGPAAFLLSWNDWQVGKWLTQGEGTQQIVERFDRAIEGAVSRAKDLRKINRDLGQLVIIGGGDMIENCAVFPHQAYQIDQDRRGQVNIARDLILAGLDRLAPLFARVDVMVVGGNHGEHRINGNRVNLHDNDDCAVFEHAAVAAERDPRLSHVGFNIATDQLAKTMEVNGWIVGTTHGHVFAKGSGQNAERKAYNWFSHQAAGRQPIGDSDLLITHHFHHEATTDWGSCKWIQTRTLDGGSPYFVTYSGTVTAPGMLSGVITKESRWTDEQYL